MAWFRKEFDPGVWLAATPGSDMYVVAQVGDPENEPVEVFFNGDYLGPHPPQDGPLRPVAFKAIRLIDSGRNVLCLKVQEGIIRGPVFLTTQQPQRYPYLGPQENARWVDLRDWTAAKLDSWAGNARCALGRQCMPDVPLLFCPGSCLEFSDQFLELKRQVGIASHPFHRRRLQLYALVGRPGLRPGHLHALPRKAERSPTRPS